MDKLSVQQFDAPIPGQSLTDEPKNSPWEHPPKYTNMNDALEFIFNQLTAPQNMAKTLAFIEKGVPAEALADTILFAGFSQGKWTPDLILMMKNMVILMIISIAQRNGAGKTTPIKYKRNKNFDDLVEIHALDTRGLGNKFKGMEPAKPAESAPMAPPQPAPSTGFMTRG